MLLKSLSENGSVKKVWGEKNTVAVNDARLRKLLARERNRSLEDEKKKMTSLK